MRPWRIHFGRETNVKNNKIPGSKNTAAASSSKQSSSIWKNQPKREETIVQCGPGAGTSTWYVSHEGYLRQPTTNKLETEPAAKGHDNEGQMRRSHAPSVLSRRATSAAPAQLKNYRYSSIASRWDHEKQISYFGDSQTRGGYTKIKNRQKTMHSYVPGLSYVRTSRNRTPPAI